MQTRHIFLVGVVFILFVVILHRSNKSGLLKGGGKSHGELYVEANEAIHRRFVGKVERELFSGGRGPGHALMWDSARALFIWNYLAPTFTCPHLLERVGSAGDGGKWMCGLELFEDADKPPDNCIVYSIGVGGDSSFEKEILDRTNCQIFVYDHTVNGMNLPQEYLGRVKFHKLGLSSTQSWGKSLGQMMEENGHEWIDFLKVDIEGAEFTELKDLKDFPFGHLNLEVHFDNYNEADLERQKKEFEGAWEWWQHLMAKGLRAFTWEDNHVVCAKGLKPVLMEYSFINVKDRRNKLLHF